MKNKTPDKMTDQERLTAILNELDKKQLKKKIDKIKKLEIKRDKTTDELGLPILKIKDFIK